MVLKETNLIDASLLTKFRRQRLKDIKILDMLINKTVEIAMDKGIIKKKNSIIVDSTHTNARYNQLSSRQVLINQAKLLRKSVYAVDEKMKDKFPVKKEDTGLLEEQMNYCDSLIKVVEKIFSLNLRLRAYSRQGGKMGIMVDEIAKAVIALIRAGAFIVWCDCRGRRKRRSSIGRGRGMWLFFM